MRLTDQPSRMQRQEESHLRSRKVFFLPVNTGFSVGDPDDKLIAFYVERSKNGLYSAIVGNVLLPDASGSNDVCLRVSRGKNWTRLADNIRRAGAIPAIQLSGAPVGYVGQRSFQSRDIESSNSAYRELAEMFSEQETRAAFQDLRIATEISIEHGFDLVQLHAAHGYLFNLLLDRRLNPRFEIAIAEVKKWAECIQKAGRKSSLRVSLFWSKSPTHMQEGFEKDCLDLGVDYLDLSAGLYNSSKREIYPSTDQLLSERWSRSIDFASRNPRQQVILSGLFGSVEVNSLPENASIGICRDLIANPNFLADPMNGCRLKMKCHYYSRGVDGLTCGSWKSAEV